MLRNDVRAFEVVLVNLKDSSFEHLGTSSWLAPRSSKGGSVRFANTTSNPFR